MLKKGYVNSIGFVQNQPGLLPSSVECLYS